MASDAPPSFQTVRLARGRHPHPRPGRGYPDRLQRCEIIGSCAGRRARHRPKLHAETLDFVRSLLGTDEAQRELVDTPSSAQAGFPADTDRAAVA